MNIFFCISGFLISKVVCEALAKGTFNLRTYLEKRFLRLAIPLLATLAIIFLLMTIGVAQKKDYFAVFLSAAYVYNLVGLSHYVSELAPTWSLSVEMQFYIFYPCILFMINKRSVLSPDRLIRFLLGMIMVSIVCAVVLHHFFHHNAEYGYFSGRWPLGAMLPLWFGCLAFAFVYLSQAEPRSKIVSFLRRYRVGAVLLSSLLFFMPLITPISSFLYSSILQPTALSVLLLGIITSSKATRALEAPLLKVTGLASYSIYLAHCIFVGNGSSGKTEWFQLFPQNIALSIFFGFVLWLCVERPTLNYLRRRFAGSRHEFVVARKPLGS